MFNEITESSQIIYQICWAIINSFWQATLIAFILAFTLKLLRNSSSVIRYRISCAALALMLVCPLATARFIGADSPVPIAAREINLSVGKSAGERKEVENDFGESETEKFAVSPKSENTISFEYARQAESFFPWIITLWLFGVLFFSLRLAVGLVHTRRLIRGAADSREPALRVVLDDLAARLKIKRTVRLLESIAVKVPMTVGWLYPVILLPPSTLLGLTPQQLQSIIAHELVHIKRYDFLINLMQAVVETLLFYHPAVRWASNKIRKEREFACDDLTLKLCGNAIVYARALAMVARLNIEDQNLATAATGGDLTNRIHRLIKNEPRRTASRFSFFNGIFIIAFLLFIVSAGFAITLQTGGKQWFGNLFARQENGINTEKPDTNEIFSLAEIDRLKIYGDDLAKENPEFRRAAVEALDKHRGSVVIMNPQTGKIYTIVNQEWAFRRGWSPASTFKMVTTVAALENNLLKNSEKGFGYDAAARLDLTRAIAVSDNNYFRSLGKAVGAELLLKYAKQLGLGSLTGINYEGEISGFVPDGDGGKNEWLGATGKTIEITPLQLAVFTSAVANGGKILVPQAAANNQTIAPNERGDFLVSPNTLSELKKGLREAVVSGTGNIADNPNFEIAGKTGTLGGKETGSGLFASYAPAENPSLVVVVALDGKNEKGAIAAEVAGRIYQKLSEIIARNKIP